MITNLLFFASFVAVAYLITCLSTARHTGRVRQAVRVERPHGDRRP